MLTWLKWAIGPIVAIVLVLALGAPAVGADPGGDGGKGSISVTVKDADGKPVADINVRVLAPQEAGKATSVGSPMQAQEEKKPRGRRKPVAEGKTNAEGLATFADVPAGTYDVIAGGRTGSRGKAAATVEAGKTVEVTITLAKGG